MSSRKTFHRLADVAERKRRNAAGYALDLVVEQERIKRREVHYPALLWLKMPRSRHPYLLFAYTGPKDVDDRDKPGQGRSRLARSPTI